MGNVAIQVNAAAHTTQPMASTAACDAFVRSRVLMHAKNSAVANRTKCSPLRAAEVRRDSGHRVSSSAVRINRPARLTLLALAALVILAIAIDGELTLGKLVALVSVIAFGILTQTFSNEIGATMCD